MKNIFFYLLIFYFLNSCQSVEKIDNVVFDYSQFSKLNFLTNAIEVNNKYKVILDEPFVDHILEISPSTRMVDWINNNIKIFGVERKIVIEIIEAAIIESEISSEEKIIGILKKPNEIKYSLKFDTVFSIYDDYDNLLAKTQVKVQRSITSPKSISLYEREQTLEELVYKSLKDFALKSEELSKKHLNAYIL